MTGQWAKCFFILLSVYFASDIRSFILFKRNFKHFNHYVLVIQLKRKTNILSLIKCYRNVFDDSLWFCILPYYMIRQEFWLCLCSRALLMLQVYIWKRYRNARIWMAFNELGATKSFQFWLNNYVLEQSTIQGVVLRRRQNNITKEKNHSALT